MASSFIYQSMNKYIDTKLRIRHLIPYRTDRNTTYETNRVYYNNYWGMTFQVLEVDYMKDGSLNQATVRWDDGCYGLICTEISPAEDYIIVKDYKELWKVPDIINTGEAYTGAEIAYWFYINDIDPFTSKYRGFWNWVDCYSKHRIQDKDLYRVYAVEDKSGAYKRCRIAKAKNDSGS